VPPRPKGVKIGDNDMLLTTEQQAQVIQVLLNLDDWPGEKRNTKQIVFLDLDPTSFGVKTVVEMQAALANSQPYNDPWGTPYGILLDMNLDDRIIGTGFPEIRGRVGVFSFGESQDTSTDDPPYKTW